MLRSIFLIVLFASLLPHSTITQSPTDESTDWIATDETTDTSSPSANITSIPSTTPPTTQPPITQPTTSTSCQYPDEFPLFSNDVCISRQAYTAIFLTSIILAGLSFLMLIGLLILCCIRKCKSSGSSSAGDDESNGHNSGIGRQSYISATSQDSKRRGQYSAVVRNIAGKTPLERTQQNNTHRSSLDSHDTGSENHVPAATSSAPYTAPKSLPQKPTRIPQKNANQISPESLEMGSRKNNSPSFPPTTTAKTGDRRVKSPTNNPASTGETEISYF